MRKLCGWICLSLCLNLFQMGWGAGAWAAPVVPMAVSVPAPEDAAPCHETPSASGLPSACQSLHACCWALAGLGVLPALQFAQPSSQARLDGVTPLRWTLRADRLFKPPKDTLFL